MFQNLKSNSEPRNKEVAELMDNTSKKKKKKKKKKTNFLKKKKKKKKKKKANMSKKTKINYQSLL